MLQIFAGATGHWGGPLSWIRFLSNIGLLFEFPDREPEDHPRRYHDRFPIVRAGAYGLALVWGVMNVKNLAQGDFVIAGGYVSWFLVKTEWLQSLFGVSAVALFGCLVASCGALAGSATSSSSPA